MREQFYGEARITQLPKLPRTWCTSQRNGMTWFAALVLLPVGASVPLLVVLSVERGLLLTLLIGVPGLWVAYFAVRALWNLAFPFYSVVHLSRERLTWSRSKRRDAASSPPRETAAHWSRHAGMLQLSRIRSIRVSPRDLRIGMRRGPEIKLNSETLAPRHRWELAELTQLLNPEIAVAASDQSAWDPEQHFQSAVAGRARWHHVHHTTSFRSLRLLRDAGGRWIRRGSMASWASAAALGLWGALMLHGAFADAQLIETLVFSGTSLVMFWLGLSIVKVAWPRIVLTPALKELPLLGASWPGHPPRYADIHALQLIRETRLSAITYAVRRYDAYELNLVLEDGRRVFLISDPNPEPVRDNARQLAAELKVPVWERS